MVPKTDKMQGPFLHHFLLSWVIDVGARFSVIFNNCSINYGEKCEKGAPVNFDNPSTQKHVFTCFPDSWIDAPEAKKKKKKFM